MSVIYDYELRLIKLLILILFPCICLDTKTVLLAVYLACSAPTDSEANGLTHPGLGQICVQLAVGSPLKAKPPAQAMEPHGVGLLYVGWLCFAQGSRLSFPPKIAFCTSS